MSDQPIRSFQVCARTKGRHDRASVRPSAARTAFVEVRNILATTPFEQVRDSDIGGALAKAKLLCRDATKELTEIFEQAALLATVDREVSDGDRRGLAALQ
jgi:hypothetical protein